MVENRGHGDYGLLGLLAEGHLVLCWPRSSPMSARSICRLYFPSAVPTRQVLVAALRAANREAALFFLLSFAEMRFEKERLKARAGKKLNCFADFKPQIYKKKQKHFLQSEIWKTLGDLDGLMVDIIDRPSLCSQWEGVRSCYAVSHFFFAFSRPLSKAFWMKDRKQTTDRKTDRTVERVG